MTEADSIAPSEPIALGFKKAIFRSGKELLEFSERAGIVLHVGDVVQ